MRIVTDIARDLHICRRRIRKNATATRVEWYDPAAGVCFRLRVCTALFYPPCNRKSPVDLTYHRPRVYSFSTPRVASARCINHTSRCTARPPRKLSRSVRSSKRNPDDPIPRDISVTYDGRKKKEREKSRAKIRARLRELRSNNLTLEFESRNLVNLNNQFSLQMYLQLEPRA